MSRLRITIVALLFLVLASAAAWWYLRPRPEFDPPQMGVRSAATGTDAEYINAQHAAQYYRDEIRKHPEAVKNYVALAQLFLQESRVTAQHHVYVPKATQLLDEALRRSPDDFEATITMASMLLTEHHFEKARELIQHVLGSQEHSAAAYGVLCDANVELGRYDEAIKACDRMLAIRPDLRSYSRAAYIREIHGDIEGSSDAMKLAVEAGVPGQEGRAWTSYILGNLYLHTGRLDTAEYIFNGVLAERPNYAYALSGLAQVWFARGNVDTAVSLLTRAAQLTPEHLFMEQLADLYRATGRDREADGIAQIVLTSFDQHRKDGWNVGREYAFFCANHGIDLGGALSQAEQEYGARPENVDVLDTYAWTLYKNGKVQEALPIIDRALARNSKNPIFCYHAGVIRHAAGDNANARAFLQTALSQNPALTMLYAGDAKRLLTSLGGIAEAGK